MEDAAKERIWSHAVGIENRALVTKGTDPTTGLKATELSSPGTGVAGVWRGNHFILTAGHVLDKAEVSDLRFFVRQTGEMKAKSASQVTMADAITAIPIRDPNAVIHRCTWEDLAVLIMRPHALGPNIEFFSFDERGACKDPSEGERVAAVGYPVGAGVPFQQRVGNALHKAVLLNPVPFGARVLPRPSETDLRFRYSHCNPARHYLIPFEPISIGLRPEGVSGAATWAPSRSRGRVWVANFRFAGICTLCYQAGAIEQVVKASTVRRFLREIFGPAQARLGKPVSSLVRPAGLAASF